MVQSLQIQAWQAKEQKRDDVNYILEPLSDIVAHSKDKALLNIMALGLLIAKTGVLTKESVIKALEKISSSKKPEFWNLTLNLLRQGIILTNKNV